MSSSGIDRTSDRWTTPRWALVAVAAVTLAAAPSPAPAAAAATASPWRGFVANNNYPHNALGTFDSVALTAGPDVGTGDDTVWTAFSPDGTRAYAYTVHSTNAFEVFDLTGATPVQLSRSTDASFGGANFGAISPDGTHAYLTGSNKLISVDLTQSPPVAGSPITVTGAGEIAVTPDGRRAYVGTGTGVAPVDLGTGIVGAVIPTGAGAAGLAASPDGSAIWVANNTAQTVTRIDVATGAAVNIDTSSEGHPRDLAVSPDGGTVWVTLSEGKLTSIATATQTLGTAVATGASTAYAVAIRPDGAVVFVSDGTYNGTGQGSRITPVDVTTTPPTVKPAITGFTDPVWLAIAPDQPARANFTAASAPAGSPTSFDASSSTASSGTITAYAWDFGDGATATTATPTTTHVYGSAGTYTATVTETVSSGTAAARVYTGQQVIRNGGASATASRTVVVSSAPQPAVTLSTSTLDFGTVAAGRTAPARTVTVTNRGQAPLHIASTALTGAGAGAYALTANSCSGQTVAPGTACTVSVAFTAPASGAPQAQLAIADDASGSPHTVLLSGTATNLGGISGTVTDAHANPVGGASVSVCTFSSRATCRSAATDPLGRFSVASLPAGQYQVEILPTGGDLFPASEVVDVAAGPDVDRTYRLSAPVGLPKGLVFNGSSAPGPTRSFWTSPSELQVPLRVLAGAPRGRYAGTVITVYAAPQGGRNGVSSLGSLTVVYYVDDAGTARFAEEIPGNFFAGYAPATHGTLGRWTVALRDAPVVGATDVAGAVVAAVLTPPPGGPYFHGGSRYEVVQTPFGFAPGATQERDSAAGRARIANGNLPPVPGSPGAPRAPLPPVPGSPGGPTRTLFPGTCPVPTPGQPQAKTPDQIYNDDGSHWFKDGSHVDRRDPSDPYYEDKNGKRYPQDPNWGLRNPNPNGPPYSIFGNPDGSGFTVDSSGMTHPVPQPNESDPNSPIVPLHPGPPVPDAGTTTPGSEFGAPQTSPSTAPATDLQGGESTSDFAWQDAPGVKKTPDARQAQRPRSAAPRARIACDGDQQEPESPDGGFDGYVDPSGSVLTTAGIPLAGARVVLLRAATRSGRPTPVPNGSRIMSPSNRRNPDRTDANGHFGWDVLPGFYRVTAVHPGCTRPGSRLAATQSALLPVPPPVTTLLLRLSCPHLHRAATRLTGARARSIPVRETAITARVTARRGRPTGLVTIAVGRRVLATVPLVNGRVSATVARLPRHTRVTVRYAGDGVNGPSATSLRTP